jgi:hypothetical protein
MSNHEQFRNSYRTEEEFFQNLDRELLLKWRRRMEAESRLNDLSAATGIVDRETLLDLQSFGYDPASAALLGLVPLVQVAWSDGAVNFQERQRISQIAGSRGLDREDAAWHKLSRYLEDRPTDPFFQLTLRALRESLESAARDEQERRRRELLADCTSVALAAGGHIGFGRVSHAERLVIDQIAAAVGMHESTGESHDASP